MKLRVIIIGLLVRCCMADAQELSALPPTFGIVASTPTLGVVAPSYIGLRIGDIAPEFALPATSGNLWASREQLGQHAIVLLLIGESPVLIGKGVTPASVLSSVVQASEQLHNVGVTTVVVSRVTGINLTGMNPQFDQLSLRDDKGDLNRIYAANPTFLTVVGIDRAGFLRRLEVVHDPAQIGSVMQQVGDTTPVLEVGKPAPDFSIPDMNGRVWRLSELRGQKNLILSFFPKCFTGGCANHLSSLNEQQANFSANDTDVLGVSVDPAQGDHGQLAFAQLQGIVFPLIPDTNRNLSILYEAARKPNNTAWRRTMLIDKDGILRFADKQVNVFTHGADTLAKMRELGIIK